MIKCPACGDSAVSRYFEARDRLHGVPGPFEVHRCANCGAGITVPIVPENELDAYYPAQYYTHEAPKGIASKINRFYVWRRAQRIKLPPRPGRVLEIGPGDCTFLAYLKRHGWDVTGLDPDPAVVRIGQMSGIRMVHGTMMQAPEDKFDLILAWHSLEHSVDPLRDLTLMIARLYDHGSVVIGVPDFGSRFARYWQDAWHNLDVPRHRIHFTHSALDRITERAGAAIVGRIMWLSPQAILESWKARSGRRLPSAVQRVVELVLSPLCWFAESLGFGDCVSITVVKGTGR